MIKIIKCLTIGLLYVFFTTAMAQTASPPPTQGLIKLSPEDFQQSVKKATLDNLKQSNDDYKRLYKQLNPPTPTHSTSTTTTSESQTEEIPPDASPKIDEDNVDKKEPAYDNNASTYYFQKKTAPSDSTTPSSGFNPYGTSKKE